ncbi:MAG: hypothetical protein IJ088_02185 [Clostridia bacterium]|nr:hypothetical protein [Clostridia bacterium]
MKRENMSEDQVKILEDFMLTPERIDSMTLTKTEEGLVKAFEKGTEFLSQRYPGETFHFISLSGDRRAYVDSYTYKIHAEKSDCDFTLRARPAGEEQWNFFENYYARYRKQELEDWIREMLKDSGIEAELIEAHINGMFGEETDPGLSIQKACSEWPLSVLIKVRIQDIGLLGELEKLAPVFSQKGLTGLLVPENEQGVIPGKSIALRMEGE